MNAPSFEETFKEVFAQRTAEQQACSHILSSQMHDGKYFCPCCHLVSSLPLYIRRAS